MAAYYNEFDPKTAAWLRELIKAGLIADGEVDTRSIELVRPDDLRGFQQCHFFAGIGGWSYALRLAGWSDDRACWTGSCPCQPFSSAGAQAGGHDPRDLWPTWFQLVKECRPVVVFGEQVEAAIGHGWLDRLCDDMEGEDYAIGAAGLPSASVGAFDKRQRLWFVADYAIDRLEGRHDIVGLLEEPAAYGGAGVMAHSDSWRRKVGSERHRYKVQDPTNRNTCRSDADGCGVAGVMVDATATRLQGSTVFSGDCVGVVRSQSSSGCRTGVVGDPQLHGSPAIGESGSAKEEGRLRQSQGSGFWSECDWIPCRDGKTRPVEPGTFPLVDGVPKGLGRGRNASEPFHPAEARVMRLRGYGNAINPEVARAFIEEYMQLCR